MFEKEVIICELKRNNRILSQLIEEIEEKPSFSPSDVLYFRETLKKVESVLRRVRKVDERTRLIHEFGGLYQKIISF